MHKIFLASFFVLALCVAAFAQEFNGEKKEDKPPTPQKIDFKKGLTTGDQVGEVAILICSNLMGRNGLNQIRKTTVETGKLKKYNADGTTVTTEYILSSIRSDKLLDEKIRMDQKAPDVAYALVYKDDKVFGIYNDTAFSPRADAVAEFRSRIWHGLEALLRYKENGSTITLDKEETILGVDFYVVTVTDKSDRKTTFYVSKKSYRVMMLTYEEDGVKYKRKFYDQKYPQGTLVPYRSVLWADDKMVEEKDISTITFGQTLDASIFNSPTP
ncbi:MAG: hypothetical protein ACK5NT_10530 [Pyrinomonadaceae bacterium]